MGWARKSIDRANLGSNQNKRGYSYKLCPYSTTYREKFKHDGEICTGFDAVGLPLSADGVWVIGNSTNLEFYRAAYTTYVCSDHTTTSGRMVYASNPPGWICDDPNCYYYTTVANGRRYREV